ncbi:MAG: 30S ribosomal protein S1 [Candidatus Babeliales bacterium]|nr:30S ribosomal protein S1 [Candidatus Babeliales bacterium]
MSKEIIRPSQFCAVKTASVLEDTDLQLNQEQRSELQALYDNTIGTFQPGKVVKGTVVRNDSDGVLVDIKYKSDGLIPRFEFSDHELKKFVPGTDIEVILDQLENNDGNVILSYEKAKAMRAWDEIMKLFEENKPVEGMVTHKVKGGLSVDIGIPAFLPGSQIDLQRVTDFDRYVGQTIQASIIKINKKRGNVIVSRRKFLNEQRSEVRKKILDTLSENQVIRGTVKNITNYGVFIDIGGVDGLLHITDMTWGRISHPSELVKIGDMISVKVLSFDKDNEKISLGLKQLTENPWEKVADELKVGSKITGKISSITDYGLFVEIAKGIEGLVHISEVSWTDRINDLAGKFKVGQDIEVLVVSLDKENRRMSLSIKQLDKNPWESVAEQFKIGQKIKGTISNITDFGVFVQLMPGIDGLVHISDLSWTEHIDHPADIYRRGQEVEAVILGIDKDNKKISLGIKQLAQDPWETIETEYPVGAIIEGTVSKITNFGAFIKLPIGIEGLVHISELSDQQVEKVEDVLKVGQKAQFRVLNVSKQDRKLGLSLKLTPSPKEERAPREERAAGQEHAPRAERAPREERPEGEKQVRAPKREKRQEAPAYNQQAQQQSTVSKTKSQFQLALEEHAARKDEDKDSSAE